MWLSKCAVSGSSQTEMPEIGTVTIGGNPLSVLCDSETRNVALLSPGGYCWRPKVGSEVLVLKCAGGEHTAVSQLSTEEDLSLEPGEILIKSDSGSYIQLANDGSICISGNINLKGSVTLNGVPLISCACEKGD